MTWAWQKLSPHMSLTLALIKVKTIKALRERRPLPSSKFYPKFWLMLPSWGLVIVVNAKNQNTCSCCNFYLKTGKILWYQSYQEQVNLDLSTWWRAAKRCFIASTASLCILSWCFHSLHNAVTYIFFYISTFKLVSLLQWPLLLLILSDAFFPCHTDCSS